MGTVVLLPQDCLPIPKSRQRGNCRDCRDAFNGMWIPFDSRSQPFDPPISYTDKERYPHTPQNVAGPMFAYRARSGFGLHPLQREFDRRKLKTKRPQDPKQCDTPSTSPTSNVAALQQTEGSSTWNPGLDIQKEVGLGINGSRTKACKIADNFLSDTEKKTGIYWQRGLLDANFTEAQDWHSGLANQTSMVHELENAPARLRRASTDSQLVEHLANYHNQASPIPGSNVNAIARTSSMPLPERWAGPAYSTSPPPSSLPLPKFSLLGQKTNFLHVASAIEQQKSKIAGPQVLESAPKAPARSETKLDVAYATMSLRRMLKLDPS